MPTVTFQRNLIGLEDLLLGVGTVQQTRGITGSTPITITKINAGNLPYDADFTMQEKIDDLQGQIDSIPNVVDQDGNLLTGLIDTSAVDISATHAGRIWQKEIDATRNEIYYGTVLMYAYDPTNGNVIVDATAYISADVVVTNAFIAADAVVTAAYIAADVVVTNAYIAADVVVTNAFVAADAVVTAAYIAADAATLAATAFNLSAAKTTLVNADCIAITDSAAADVNKRITYANLKTMLNADLSFAGTVTGAIRRSIYAENVTYTTITGTIPWDNTVPQVGEGTQIFTGAITMAVSTYKIRATCHCWGTINDVGAQIRHVTLAAFVDGAANAVAATGHHSGFTSQYAPGFNLTLVHEFAPGDTAAHTITFRIGVNNTAYTDNCYINGLPSPTGRIHGGVGKAVMLLEEIIA